jgi:hypothetical protein
MYLYEDYIKFQKQYLIGLKSITLNTSHPSVSISNQSKAQLVATTDSFIAHFNRIGNLIHILNPHPRSNYKYSYFYDKQNRVIKILEINKVSNALSKENNIIYQDKDNFIEHIRVCINTEYETVNEIRHSYENDIKIIERTNVDEDDWFLSQEVTFDNIIQETLSVYNNSFDFVFISELNKNNQVVKEYSVEIEYDLYGALIGEDINYTPEEYYLNTYHGSGLIQSISYISNEPWIKTFEHKFNERGHWIQEIIFIDNSLQYFCERKLEYF